MLTNDGY